MGSFDFAPTQPNTLRPLQIGLCVLDVPALPPEKPEARDDQPPEPQPEAKDPYLAKMTVEVVEEAWVLLFPAPASAKTMILCRTTKRGQIVKIERGEVDGAVPDGDKTRLVFVNEGASYLCYWSYHKALFKKALADVDKNLAQARRRHPFFDFVAQPWKRERVFDAEFDGGTQPAQHDRDKLSFLFHNLGTTGHGYMAHHQLAEANRDPSSPYLAVPAELFKGKLATQCWVFARRSAVSATYLAEFATRYALRLRAQSAWHYAQFHAATAFVEAAKNARRVDVLDKQLRADIQYGSGHLPQSQESLAYAEQYWDFAWQCATKEGPGGRIERSLFEKSVNVVAISSAWKDAAYEIGEKIGVAHPAYTTKDGSEIDDKIHYKFIMHPEPLLAYFDIYRFGAEQGEKPWVTHLDEAEESIDDALRAIAEKLRKSFAQSGGYRALLQDLAIHVKDDDARYHLQCRYLDATEDAQYDFWLDLPEKKGEGAEKDDESGELEVERPDPLIDIQPYLLVAIVSAAKQVDLFKDFFERRGHALVHRINTAKGSFDELFSKIINFDEKLLKSKVETIKTEDIHLEPDFEAGKIVIHKDGKPIGDFEFVIEDTGAKKFQHVKKKSRSGRTRWERHKVPVKRVKAERFEPLREFEEAEEGQIKLPAWFSAFGYAVLVAYDLFTLKEQLKEHEKIEVYGRIGVNLSLGVASLSEAFEVTFHGQIKNKFIKGAGDVFGKLGKVAEKGAVVAEMVLTAREGAILLFDHEDSEVTDALEEGNLKVAYAQEAKGIVLLGGAAGAGAVAILVGGLASGGLVLAGAAITVAVIDLYSWLESDGSSMRGTTKKLNKALGQELGSDYAPYRGGERFDKCRTQELLMKLANDVERVDQLVAASR